MADLIMTASAKRRLLAGGSYGSSSTGFMVGAKVMLFTNQINPGPDTVTADLTEPVWTGYARQTITWQTPYRAAGGTAELVGASVFFATGTDANELVRGFAVTDASGTLLWVQPAPTAIPIVGAMGLTVLPLVQER